VNARAFALHREKVTNQSLSEELLEAEEADEPQAEPTTAPTTQPLELGGKRDVLEDLLLAPTSRSSSIVEVAELPGVVASGPAPLRGQTAQRMEEYGAEDLPPLWDRVAWVNRVNRSLSGFMLNNVVALVDPAPRATSASTRRFETVPTSRHDARACRRRPRIRGSSSGGIGGFALAFPCHRADRG
jgi:hypothetical protein